MLRVVRFGCVGSYEAYADLLKSVQDAGNFLQVQVLSLSPVKRTEAGVLKGELLFAGLRLVKPREDGTRVSLGGKKDG